MRESTRAEEVRAYLLLGLCAVIWGFAFVAQRLGAEHAGAFTFTSVRSAIGAASLMPLIWWLDRRGRRTRAETRSDWAAALRPGLVIGIILFGGSILQQLGVELTTAGNAAFVTGLYIVLVPLVGPLLGHRIAKMTWLGVSLAVPGLFLLTWTGTGIGTGDLLCLVGSFFWAAHILLVGRWSRRLDPIRLSVVQFVANGVLAGALAPLAEERPFSGIPEAAGALLFAGLVSTGVGYTLQVVSQRHARESVAAMIMSLESMFGAFGGALLLGERLSASGLVGAGLMMAGILLAQAGPRRSDPPAVPVPEPPSTAIQ